MQAAASQNPPTSSGSCPESPRLYANFPASLNHSCELLWQDFTPERDGGADKFPPHSPEARFRSFPLFSSSGVQPPSSLLEWIAAQALDIMVRLQTKVSRRVPVRIIGAEWTQNGLGMRSRLPIDWRAAGVGFRVGRAFVPNPVNYRLRARPRPPDPWPRLPEPAPRQGLRHGLGPELKPRYRPGSGHHPAPLRGVHGAT